MLGFVSEKKLKEQEQLFEAALLAERTALHQLDEAYGELLARHTEVLQKYEDNLQQLELAINNETLLNEQTGRLAKKINNFEAFPSKKFNISKAIDVLTKDLSSKTLATFNYKYIEALPIDQVESILKYSTNKLKSQENGKEV